MKHPSGPVRCMACHRTISRNKKLCLHCATFGEEASRTVLSADLLSKLGQIQSYVCLKCGRQTVCSLADAGLTPYMMTCRALGEGRCVGPAFLDRHYPKGDSRAPKPEWEFYRPTGLDLEKADPGWRSMVAVGLLDVREIKLQLVRASK